MPPISVKAHFDGTAIQLDENCELPRNVPLLVTILDAASADAPLPGWYELGAQGPARAYGSNEPDYSSADFQP